MRVIVQYRCPNCNKETGQRDYVSHTDGQCFAIPDPKREVVPFCPYIRSHRTVNHGPVLQSPGFCCTSPSCPGFKVRFDAKKRRMQDAHILCKLRDTEYRVTVEGNSVMDVKRMLEREGIRKTDTYRLSGAKLQKWTLYTEDKLKKITAKGDSHEDIKTALEAITGLSYSTYQIIAKAASFKLHHTLFPPSRNRRGRTQ